MCSTSTKGIYCAISSLFRDFDAVAIAVPVRDHTTGYNGVKVLRIPTGNSTARLDTLIDSLDLDVWTHSSRPNSHIDVQVPKDVYTSFTSKVNSILKEEGVMHEDLGASIRKEAEGIVSSADFTAQAGLANNAWWNAYHPIADHFTFLDDLVATFPNNAKIGVNIFGSSWLLEPSPAIIWHGTVHAREPSSTLHTTSSTTTANSTEVKSIVDKYDFYIFPIVNPDGFAFSQTSTRLWRKNRSVPPSGSTLLRNWNVAWSQTNGASTSPCSETYKGLAPVDAPETQGLQAFVNARAQSSVGAKMYIDWHSYGQYALYAYGYNCSKVAPDATELNSLAAGWTSTVRNVFGTRYTYGPSCSTLYCHHCKIKYSYTIELRDTGSSGFVLPANQIRPTGEESWAGINNVAILACNDLR
ncbi:putative carboxypeptidase [Coprinopsis sp. MPI-PUGE-AT-0042]|nr:putative carboxypeptidase [Coprinopsis sp. MPI-PUGE-AT-0042]